MAAAFVWLVSHRPFLVFAASELLWLPPTAGRESRSQYGGSICFTQQHLRLQPVSFHPAGGGAKTSRAALRAELFPAHGTGL